MDKSRFDAIIAAYGADPRRWPASERNDAEAFAAREGADISEARALDALMESATVSQPSDLLTARILAARKRSHGISPLAALAACMIGGVLAGYGVGLAAPVSDDVDMMIVAAFEAPDWIGETP